MDKKTQIHETMLSFLDDYFLNTPAEIIQKEIAEITNMEVEGVSAIDYFLHFNSYYLGNDELVADTHQQDVDAYPFINNGYTSFQYHPQVYKSAKKTSYNNVDTSSMSRIFNNPIGKYSYA